MVRWSIITAGFALAIAAAFGALSQAKGLSAAVEGIARNPAAANDIRGNLILGLVLIESLVIYVLLISLILFFIKPFGGLAGAPDRAGCRAGTGLPGSGPGPPSALGWRGGRVCVAVCT